MSLELSAQQLTAIAQEFGTPLYVYHAERIGEQYKRLLSAFDKTDARFFYASKALTNIKDSKLRRRVVDLVEEIAGDQR